MPLGGSTAVQELAERLLQIIDDRVAVKIYIEVLTSGPQPVATLTSLYGRPASAGARGHLLDLGISAERMTPGGKTAVFAVRPDVAWTAVAARVVWLRSNQFSSVTSLPPTGDRGFDHIRTLCEGIALQAQRLWKQQSLISSRLPIAATGSATMAQATAEAIARARREIRSMSRTPRLPQVSLVWTCLTERLRQGVTYRRIVDMAEVVDHGLAVVRRDVLGAGFQLRVLEQRQIKKTFYIIDNRYLVLQNAQERRTGKSITGSVTPHTNIIRRYTADFEAKWASASDALPVVGELQASADELLDKAKAHLSSDEVLWFDDLIRWGKFSTFARRAEWSDQREQEVISRSLRANLISLNAERQPVPAYRVTDAILASLPHLMDTDQEPICSQCWDLCRRCHCAEL